MFENYFNNNYFLYINFKQLQKKSIEEDFVTWMDKFWSLVCNHFGISASEQDGIRYLDFK
jgi:hypothetical protein